MVYKVKDTENERSTGFRCNQSGKEKIMKIKQQLLIIFITFIQNIMINISRELEVN